VSFGLIASASFTSFSAASKSSASLELHARHAATFARRRSFGAILSASSSTSSACPGSYLSRKSSARQSSVSHPLLVAPALSLCVRPRPRSLSLKAVFASFGCRRGASRGRPSRALRRRHLDRVLVIGVVAGPDSRDEKACCSVECDGRCIRAAHFEQRVVDATFARVRDHLPHQSASDALAPPIGAGRQVQHVQLVGNVPGEGATDDSVDVVSGHPPARPWPLELGVELLPLHPRGLVERLDRIEVVFVHRFDPNERVHGLGS
jgi:hypothetical protein